MKQAMSVAPGVVNVAECWFCYRGDCIPVMDAPGADFRDLGGDALSRVLTKRPFPLQDGTALQVFVAEVANQIVGIAVIRKEMVS